jgi:hypothetical protein
LALLLWTCALPPDFAGAAGLPPLAPTERAALEALFKATNRSRWKDDTGWGSASSPCDWRTVACADDGQESHVTGLFMSDAGLEGVLPATLLTSLPRLKTLDVARNRLSGPVPEGVLAAWDRHELDFSPDGNAFADLVARVRIVSEVTGTRCTDDADVRFTFSLAATGEAHMESIRCTPGTERETRCLVREGHAYRVLPKLGRGLHALSYRTLEPRYGYAFGFTTHDVEIATTAWFGDGSMWTLSTYGRQGPARAWAAQAQFLSLMTEATWETERYSARCDALENGRVE